LTTNNERRALLRVQNIRSTTSDSFDLSNHINLACRICWRIIQNDDGDYAPSSQQGGPKGNVSSTNTCNQVERILIVSSWEYLEKGVSKIMVNLQDGIDMHTVSLLSSKQVEPDILIDFDLVHGHIYRSTQLLHVAKSCRSEYWCWCHWRGTSWRYGRYPSMHNLLINDS